MEKPWLKNYPAGVSEYIDLDEYNSVAEVFEQAVGRYAELPAFCNMGTTLSYREMGRLCEDLAAYLQSIPGMEC